MSIDQPLRGPLVAMLRLASLGFLLITGCGSPESTAKSAATKNRGVDDPITSARETLRRGADLNACKGVIHQLNEFLKRNPQEKPAPLAQAERDLLTGRFALEPDELAEVENSAFTLLDANHLEQCAQLREIAAALQVDDLPPVARAQAAFGWVMRQVRLRERNSFLLPVGMVLRRGWGNSLERASAFLAILEQMGIPGVLVTVPSGTKEQGPPMLWCAGAWIDKDLVLFDPRLGLPLPGPGGKGVAKLSEVYANAELVNALQVDDKIRYDVSPERAKLADIYLATPLPALSPRMRWLQGRLNLPSPLVFSVDVVSFVQTLEGLTQRRGTTVKVWNPVAESETPVRALRVFLPPDDGGVDKRRRREIWRLEAVPWNLMPRGLLALEGELGARLKDLFGSMFLTLILDPQGPRELMLRGRYEEATLKLVQVRTDLRRQKDTQAGQDTVPAAVADWCERAAQAYGSLASASQEAARNPAAQTAVLNARAGIAGLWKESQAVQVYLAGLASDPLLSEVDYLLALCKHEQAEISQRQLDRNQAANEKAPADEIKKTRESWQGAAEWWDTCLEDAPTSALAPAARRERARTLAMLGQTSAAVLLLQNPAGDLTDLEKVAQLYLARQLKPR